MTFFRDLAGLVLVSLIVLPSPARCDPPPLRVSDPAVKSALSQIISEQLAAFHAGDFTRAYAFAALEIRNKYNRVAFEQMVRLGFPLLTRFTSTEFGPVLDDGENGVVYVRVSDARGKQLYLYSLRREGSGWKVMGVSQREDDFPEQSTEPSSPPPERVPPMSA
jgi:hypothetical protein